VTLSVAEIEQAVATLGQVLKRHLNEGLQEPAP